MAILLIGTLYDNRVTESNTGINVYLITNIVAATDEISSMWINLKPYLITQRRDTYRVNRVITIHKMSVLYHLHKNGTKYWSTFLNCVIVRLFSGCQIKKMCEEITGCHIMPTPTSSTYYYCIQTKDDCCYSWLTHNGVHAPSPHVVMKPDCVCAISN